MTNGGSPRALFLNGSVGAGKTVTAATMGDLLEEAGIPHAVVDLDELVRAWPAPPNDPFQFRLSCANLATMWTNYAAAGATFLVLAGVVESRADVAAYRHALGGIDLTVVWLRAPTETLRQRLRVRHRDAGPALDWHLARAAELDAILTGAEVADFDVWTRDRTVVDIGREILRRLGCVAAEAATLQPQRSGSGRDE